MRRLERKLVSHYQSMMSAVVTALTADNYETAVQLASAPDLVRGYEDVKMRNVRRYVDRLAELGIDASVLHVS
jgi:indolepyruvate ferredoxin oxidoreductase